MVKFLLIYLTLFVYTHQNIIPLQESLDKKQVTNSVYFIMAPKIIRPGRPFEVSLSIKGTFETVPINLMIRKDNEIMMKDTAYVDQDNPKTIQFQVPSDATAGVYILRTFAISPSWQIAFYNETTLTFEEKTVSVFIQTDKALYKSGQKVNFRIIAVTQDFKPYPGNLSITITDAKQNRIKQWNNQSNEYGVISNSLELSDQPVLGKWKIIASVKNEVVRKEFIVDEYVLPKFQVTIDVGRITLFSDEKIIAILKAQYTFGKPVTGRAEILTQLNIFGQVIVMQNMEINNGRAVIEIPMKHFKRNMYSNPPRKASASITAFVTESTTNITQNGTVEFNVYSNRINLEIIKTSNSFKAGLPYTFLVTVTLRDGSQLPGNNNLVNISTGFSWDATKMVSKLYPIPANGIVQVDLDVIKDANEVRLKAQYGEEIMEETVWTRFYSPSLSFIDIFTTVQDIKSGETTTFQVSSSTPLEKLNYVVLSRGTVVSNGALQMALTNKTTFGLKITNEMVPRSRLLIYHILETGEVVTSAVNFEVKDGLQNKVDISFSFSNGSSIEYNSQSVQPGSEVLITGHAAPKSFVGLLAVDQSVRLLKTGNDITTHEVLEELSTYNFNEHFGRWIYRSGVSGNNAADILHNSGVVVLTNGYIHGSERRHGMPGTAFRTSGVAYNQVQPVAMASVSYSLQESSFDMAPDNLSEEETGTVQIRQLFPETWVWLDTFASENGSFEHHAKVPDTITSWVASAISVDKELGIGIGNNIASLRVFRPFFVSMNLPYSVIRGESVHLQVLIFYYLNKEDTVTITLEESDDFKVEPKAQTKSLRVKQGDVTSVSFNITPNAVGSIDMRVTGRCSGAGDTEIRQLLVKPEGITQYESKSWFFTLDGSTENILAIDNFSYFAPNGIEIVDGSKRAELTAIGDIMGITLKNLGNLVRMPYGCGEQNMINFVPNILVLSYLSATNQLTGAIKDKAINHLLTGYQRQLTYKRNDGSFSAFGNRDASGSTWLTAFVLKSFHQASFYTDLDPKILDQSIFWLLMQQNANGSFDEVGRVIDAELQGGATSGISLTAYVLISLVELKELGKTEIYSAKMKAQMFLESEFANLTDPYAICIVTYALTLAGSHLQDEAFLKLKSIAQPETISGGSFWKKSKSSNSKVDIDEVNPADIEITSYALLTYIKKGEISKAAPIIKWLSSQRNSNGGFQSTQDTVIGLQALASFAAKTFVPETDVYLSIKEINIKSSTSIPELNFSITHDNSLVLQSELLKITPASYKIYASGKGSAFVQLNLQYNVIDPEELDSFFLQLTVHSNKNGLTIEACAGYLDEGMTGMVVMEIVLPSGYLADKNSFNKLLNSKIVQRMETHNEETEIIAYFNEITNDHVCIEVSADKIYLVDNIKAVPVRIYEFYKPEKRTTKFYKA